MHLFFNDIPIHILEKSNQNVAETEYNTIINSTNEPVVKVKLLHKVLIKNITIVDFKKIFELLDSLIFDRELFLTLIVDDYNEIKSYIKSKYKIIEAAGGLVRKKEKVLMIYRLKKWDLPKGKLMKGEKSRNAAKREVEEECNIEVNVVKKICTTYHTYSMKKQKILKRTKWYEMLSINDKKMKPQKEEDIEIVRWLTPKEYFHALKDSYKSISFVFGAYFNKKNS